MIRNTHISSPKIKLSLSICEVIFYSIRLFLIFSSIMTILTSSSSDTKPSSSFLSFSKYSIVSSQLRAFSSQSKERASVILYKASLFSGSIYRASLKSSIAFSISLVFIFSMPDSIKTANAFSSSIVFSLTTAL